MLLSLFASKDLKALILNINITNAGKKNRKAAIKLVRELMKYVTKPGVACTDDGKVTFYWDDKVNYADLEVHKDGASYSVYMRSRADKSESYTEFTLGDVKAHWVRTHFAPFLHPEQNTQHEQQS